jgi:DNA-binding transcriptional MerR regulator
MYSVDEIIDLTGIRPYVLRFWELEFDSIRPITGDDGVKLYQASDVEAILEIKKLLFEDKLNIERAKREIRMRSDQQHRKMGVIDLEKLTIIKEKLNSIVESIDGLENKYQ